MMFQRAGPSPSDPDLGSFYGLALPLVKQGIPAEPVQLENATLPGALVPYKILLLTYEGMKPMTPEVHGALAGWVKHGGILIFMGDDNDPYNGVKAWWNDPARRMSYRAPREHLFIELGLPKDAATGTHEIGQGMLVYDVRSPAELSRQKDGSDQVLALVRYGCGRASITYRETNYLALRRGPYVVAAGLAESRSDDKKILSGRFLNLFDPDLDILETVALTPGRRYLLLDLDRIKTSEPAILASACKTLGAQVMPNGAFEFYAEGPANVEAVVRLATPVEPKEATIDGNPLLAPARTWDPGAKTLLLRFPNSAHGHRISIR
jgi:hypothetical protein